MSSTGNGRSVFLVTYSQVDKVLCKDKEDFAPLVTEEFKDCVVEQWACSEEKHKDGRSRYHLCIKLDRIKRWKLVRQRIQAKYNICVNFSDHHTNYYNAYKYVCKEDNCVLKSKNHKIYADSPQTSKASRARKSADSDKISQVGQKMKKLDILAIYDVIILGTILSQTCNSAHWLRQK